MLKPNTPGPGYVYVIFWIPICDHWMQFWNAAVKWRNQSKTAMHSEQVESNLKSEECPDLETFFVSKGKALNDMAAIGRKVWVIL